MSKQSFAVGYGIYEPRGQAMGGAGVAAAVPGQAHFYNPALAAYTTDNLFHARFGQSLLPTVIWEATKNVDEAVSALQQDVDATVVRNIFDFIRGTDADAAQLVTAELNKLDTLIETLDNQSYWAELFTGFTLGRTNEKGGRTFFFGSRIIGGGASSFEESDKAILDVVAGVFTLFEEVDPDQVTDQQRRKLAFSNAMALLNAVPVDSRTLDDYTRAAQRYVELAGDPEDPLIEVIEARLPLADATNVFISSADVEGAVIYEWGTTFANKFRVNRHWDIAIGATPKLLQIDAYDENIIFGREKFRLNGKKKSYLDLNFDLGFAATLGNIYRVAIAMKDVIPSEYSNNGAFRVDLHTRARFGLAVVNSAVNWGLDVDLTKNRSIAGEPEVQEVSFGVEYAALQEYKFQAGYRHDLLGNRDTTLSFGVGIRKPRYMLDIALSRSASASGIGAQFGLKF